MLEGQPTDTMISGMTVVKSLPTKEDMLLAEMRSLSDDLAEVRMYSILTTALSVPICCMVLLSFISNIVLLYLFIDGASGGIPPPSTIAST